jgi:GT2 family glycosyltransferase/glycosyltransferase involved in cell wall biosynthesis
LSAILPATDTATVRLCIFGPFDADWLAGVARDAPDATLAMFAPAASTPPASELIEQYSIPQAGDMHAVLRAAVALFPGDDLILLRSGSALPPWWFTRLLRALSVADVLVATPMDNLDAARAPLPPGMRSAASVAAIDSLCQAHGRGALIDWDGFSPLLSAWNGARARNVDLQQIQNYTLAQTLGSLRGVLLDHLYVADPARALAGPEPPAAGADSVPPSPLGDLRERVGEALAQRTGTDAEKSAICQAAYCGLDGKPVVLHILHGWGGGAERFVRDLASADRARHHLVLSARGNFPRRRFGETLQLHDGALSQPPLRSLTLPNPIRSTAVGDPAYRAFLDAILGDFAIDAVMVSSLIGHSLDALRTRLPTILVSHDYYPLWPLLHRDFGAAGLDFGDAQLAADLAAAGVDFEFSERDPAYWRGLREAYVAAVLAAQARIVAPSRSTLANLLRIEPRFAALALNVIAHGIAPWPADSPMPAPAAPARAHLRLVVPGRVRRGKGAELLRAALPALREHAEIFLLGAGAEGEQFFGTANVHVVLNYRREDLPRMLARIQPDAALLMPTVAETFSYTLSELFSLGLPVVATRLGALAERVSDGVTGWLVAPAADAVAATVARLAAERGLLAAARSAVRQIPQRSIVDMATDYSALLPNRPRAHAAAALAPMSTARLDAQTNAALLGDAQRLALAQHREIARHLAELSRRAEWGISLEGDVRRAQVELERFGKAHAELQADFEERTQWALALDAQREQLEYDLATLRGSLSWRITRPLRYAMRKLRAARVHLGVAVARLRSSTARTRGSLGQRGVVGTLRRAARELRRPFAPRAPVRLASEPSAGFTPFAVPRADTPRVSIVIPVYNKIDYTAACLRSLAEHADGVPIEVIVVDDGSSDATAERLAQIDGVHVLRNERNLGFVGSCNAGAAAASGEFVLFLNNDTVVTRGWLAALLRCFAEEPEAGLVGAQLVYPDGRLQEAGGIVFSDGSGWNYGRFGDPADPRYAFRREADYCSGAAIMLPLSLFRQLGGFDQRYAPAYYEDTDLAFGVRAAGKKVLYEPRAVVVHFEGVTAGTDVGSGIKQYQAVNRRKFLEKWKNELARQPALIDDERLAPAAANFRARRRVLIVDSYTPTPDQDSGSLRMVNLMRLLRERGYQVSFLPDNHAHAGAYTEALQALGVEALYHPYVADTATWLRANGSALDIVLLSRHYVAINYVGLVRLYAPRARLIFDTVDLHYLREQRTAAIENKPDLARHAAATKASELKLMRECDLTLVVSTAEKALLAHEVPAARVEVLSNVHEIYGCRRAFAARKDLVFVGSFQHPPNIDAVLWFTREVFALVRAQAPIHLHIIGNNAPAGIAQLEMDGVTVHGYVEDLAPFMDGCRVSVAPLRVGAGIKGKINMAMSYGLPVVATTTAVEGMHVRAGEDILVADTPQEFAAAILRVYNDEALWKILSANGLDNVRTHFSFDAARKALQVILPD